MTLKDLLKANLNFHINVVQLQPNIEEKMIDDVEIRKVTFNTMVTVMIYDPNKLTGSSGEPTIVAKIQAVGSGKTQRSSERDGIKECLFRFPMV